jgi:Zn-dependent protease with chaperone function
MIPSNEPITLFGNWQDGASSASLPAVLRCTGDRLSLTIGDRKAIACNQKDLGISPKIGRTARYLNFSDLSGQFETSDHENLDRIEALRQKGIAQFIHTLEQHLVMVIASTFVVLGLAASYFIWGIPAGSKFIAEHLPDTLLQQAADDTLTILESRYLEPSKLSEDVQQRVLTLIAAQSPDYDIEKFYIRDGGELGANAFALPDGSIIFTDQIIQLAADNDAELLGVFGHELGHVVHKHSLRQILQSSAISVTIALVGGDISAMGDIVLTLPIVFTQLSFSRQFELESDSYGGQYLADRGFERSALASMLKKLHASHGSSCETARDELDCKTDEAFYKYLSTHPYIEDRVRAIEQAAQ